MSRRTRARIYYIPNGYDHHIADALDGLFTEVKPFGCRDVPDYVARRVLAHETPDATRVLLDEVRRMRPDLVYAESAYNIDPEAFAFIRRVLRVPVTMWYGDPSSPAGEVERLVRFARFVDWQIVVDDTPVDAAARRGLDNVELVPNFGYDHYFAPTRRRKRFDVLFSGKSYDGLEAGYPEAERRRSLVRRVDRELDGGLFVIGEGWERHGLRRSIATRVPEWEINTLNNAARIVLAYDAAQLPGFTSVRTWNALLSGAFLLIRRFPGIERYFENHRHLVWFESEDECVASIRRYLADDRARVRIARAGRALVDARGWTFSTLARYIVARGTGRERRRFAEIHGGLGPVRERGRRAAAIVRRPPRVTLVTFGTPDWTPAVERLTASALRFGADAVEQRGVHDLLGTPFHLAHLDLFRERRGYGYWIWKPYFVREALRRAGDGDVVIYADAGIEVIADLKPLIEIARERAPVVAFGIHGQRNREWTRRDAFVALGCDERRFWDAAPFNAALQVFRRSDAAIELVNAWLAACTTGRLVTDDDNTLGRRNLPGFREHRHDQALWSLLCEERGIERFRDPSQWGNDLKLPAFRIAGEFLQRPCTAAPMENSPYGTLVFHHRQRAPRATSATSRRVRAAVPARP